MLQPLENDSREPVPTRAASDLRIVRPDNPYLALGLAVSHLMTKPAFAALRFGRKAMTGKQAAYLKRHDPDGSTRASRLAVNKFVDQQMRRLAVAQLKFRGGQMDTAAWPSPANGLAFGTNCVGQQRKTA